MTTPKVIEDGYWLMRVLSHWEIRLPALGLDIPLSHIILKLNYLLKLSARLGSNKYQFDQSYWFDSTRNLTPDLPHTRPALYRFGHRTRLLVAEYGAAGLLWGDITV